METPRGQLRCWDQRGAQGPEVTSAGSNPATTPIPAAEGEKEAFSSQPDVGYGIGFRVSAHFRSIGATLIL